MSGLERAPYYFEEGSSKRLNKIKCNYECYEIISTDLSTGLACYQWVLRMDASSTDLPVYTVYLPIHCICPWLDLCFS